MGDIVVNGVLVYELLDTYTWRRGGGKQLVAAGYGNGSRRAKLVPLEELAKTIFGSPDESY